MVNPRQLLALVRQHWGIENDCNWSFDMEFAEDDGAWCTKNKAIFVLGALRMVAYNILQRLRKTHVQVRTKSGKTSARPWRDLYETVHMRLLVIGVGFKKLLCGLIGAAPIGRAQPAAPLPAAAH